jgi:hypothetical protein
MGKAGTSVLNTEVYGLQDSSPPPFKVVFPNYVSTNWRVFRRSCRPTLSLQAGAPWSLLANGKSAYSGGRRGKPEQAFIGIRISLTLLLNLILLGG